MKRYEINKAIRKLLNMTQTELARRVEVKKQTISNYELGKNVLRPIERVIELELDEEIQNQSDNIRNLCEILKSEREGS